MDKPNLKNMKELMLKHQFLVIIMVCAVFFYIIYSFDVSNEDKKFILAERQEQDLKEQFQSLQNLQVSMNDDVSQLPQLQATFNEWKSKLVSPQDLPDLLNEILKLGTSNNLQFILFTPGTDVRDGEYFKEPIKVVVSGNFSDIANFISQIANMDHLVTIKDFVVAKSTVAANKTDAQASSEQHLSAELNLEVFHVAVK